jgi:hypothetical protein
MKLGVSFKGFDGFNPTDREKMGRSFAKAKLKALMNLERRTREFWILRAAFVAFVAFQRVEALMSFYVGIGRSYVWLI